MIFLSKFRRLLRYIPNLISNIPKIKTKNYSQKKYVIFFIISILIFLSIYVLNIYPSNKTYILVILVIEISIFILYYKLQNLLTNIHRNIDEKFSGYEIYNQFLKMKYENEKYTLKHIKYRGNEYVLDKRTSIVIGKANQSCDVDIDLANDDYSSLVSKIHAIMNFENNIWYIEDVSKNGVYIERNMEKIRLEKNQKYEVYKKDRLYISLIKLDVE